MGDDSGVGRRRLASEGYSRWNFVEFVLFGVYHVPIFIFVILCFCAFCIVFSFFYVCVSFVFFCVYFLVDWLDAFVRFCKKKNMVSAGTLQSATGTGEEVF